MIRRIFSKEILFGKLCLIPADLSLNCVKCFLKIRSVVEIRES